MEQTTQPVERLAIPTQTTRQTIVSDERVRQALAKIPELIERIETKRNTLEDAEFVLKYDVSVNQIKEEAKQVESEIAFEVFQELDDNGKKKFSNDTARQAELNRRLNESKDYAAVMERLNAASQNRGRAEMEVAKNRNSLSALYETLRTERDIVCLADGLAREKMLAPQIDGIDSHGRQIIINLNEKSRGNGNG
jgi:hypothetical protein